MKFNLRNLFKVSMIAAGLLLAAGCGQNEDIVKPQDNTTITLTPERLPELESSYVYELWMVKVDGPDTTFVSLGKFTWDNYLKRFHDPETGDQISGIFELPETWWNYDLIVVSVENSDDPSPLPSGTYMLMDEVVDPATRLIIMKFPVSMFEATGFYFVDTPTDDTTNLYNTNKGLWLCSRFASLNNLHDTLGIFTVDTIMYPDSLDTAGWSDPDTIGVIWPPDSNFTVIDTFVIFGYDTLFHRRIDIEWNVIYDTLYDYNVFVGYDIDSITSSPTRPLGPIQFNLYSNPLENLPDVAPFGWRYNAWVLHEYADESMNLPKVAPFGFSRPELYAGDTTWTVLPLGAFYRPDSADISNNYLDNREVPNYPGEDFVVDPGIYGAVNFRYGGFDATGGDWGSIVVGVEPDPAHLTIDATRNFPLVFLTDFLRAAGDSDVNEVHDLHNWSDQMPVINVTVEFSE